MQLTGPPLLRSPITAGKLLPANAAAAAKPPSDCSLAVLNYLSSQPTTPPENLTSLLERAWNSDPLTTLKLVFRLYGSNKEAFYAAAIWAHQNHPLTLACNISVLSSFGFFKDLLEILRRLLLVDTPEDGKSSAAEAEEEQRGTKKEREIDWARRVVIKYRSDSNYRYLHERISDLFADSLKSDLEHLNSGDVEKISLASKYCPSVDSVNDKSTLICERIAKKIFPRESNSVYKQIEEAHYAYRVRERLRKEVLVPLREALNAGKNSLPQTQQGSKSRSSRSNKFFTKGIDKRFRLYFKIATKYARTSYGSSLASDTEIECMKKRLENSLAICDVSANTRGSTMKVGIPMSLLISEISEPPWRGKVFTFSNYTKLRKIEGGDVRSKIDFIKHLECDEGVDFRKVFERILQVWVSEKLSKEKMVKRVFVFSDRDFEEASKNYKKEEYREVWESYRKRGIRSVPEIVFFNLRNTFPCSVVIATPARIVTEEHMIGDFFKSLMNLFLEKEGAQSLDVLMKSVRKHKDDDLGEEKARAVDLVLLD